MQIWLLVVVLLLIFYVSLTQPDIWTNISARKATLGTLLFFLIMIMMSVNSNKLNVVTYEPTAHLSYETKH
jgi:hypothetical protein